ncbi:unnamed protein product [Cyprideis torosa]|uniref:Uncharacterized protein n=1 Tax=Cyprideis torosa TaxID=163714 RepID=A0A7R8ZG71_9CRUS|nr:unnamed protein product [Cyprideis torosa]CAG0880951.1 unnamed protein product [Cyprideis torosa]
MATVCLLHLDGFFDDRMVTCVDELINEAEEAIWYHYSVNNTLREKRRFRIDNTDHIIDVNKGNSYDYDQVNIFCPYYDSPQDDVETYIIYNVSKDEYDSCRITTNPNPRTIAICDTPFKPRFFTITFRSFSPQPGGLEFKPGHDYYFISTSSKENLHRRTGGRCSTNHMKVVFKVCCKEEDKKPGLKNTVDQAPLLPSSAGTSATGDIKPQEETPTSFFTSSDGLGLRRQQRPQIRHNKRPPPRFSSDDPDTPTRRQQQQHMFHYSDPIRSPPPGDTITSRPKLYQFPIYSEKTRPRKNLDGGSSAASFPQRNEVSSEKQQRDTSISSSASSPLTFRHVTSLVLLARVISLLLPIILSSQR